MYTRALRKLGLVLLLGSATVGCATGSAVSRTADRADLTVAQAEQIVAQYRNRHDTAAANNDPLTQPKSLDDVLEILRRDEIDLFPNAVKFASNEGSVRGKALAGQLLVSWGDAQHLLADLLTKSAHDLEDQRQHLEKRNALGKLSDEEKAHLAKIESTLKDLEGVEAALRRVGTNHISEGMTLAQQVITAAPNDYEGYRVAADYYHQVEDWAKFDEMVKKLEALNPQSNGLLFLRAEAARDRDQDPSEAKKLFKEALSRDPKFVRAQVAITVLQPDLSGAWVEMKKLAALSPKHQLVVWMGPTVQRAYEDWRTVQQRRITQNANRAMPGAN